MKKMTPLSILLLVAVTFAAAGCGNPGFGSVGICPGILCWGESERPAESEKVSSISPAPSAKVTKMALAPSAKKHLEGRTMCAGNELSGRMNRWVRPGAHPYTGTLSYAISRMSGVPKSVKANWKQLVKSGKGTKTILRKGDRFCAMVYSARGYNHVWKNVQVAGDWTTSGKKPAGATVYSVSSGGMIWELVRPAVCDNWAYRIRLAKQTSASKRIAKKVVKQVASTQKVFRVRVRVWDWDTIPQDLQKKIMAISAWESNKTYSMKWGAVSRDVGPLLMQYWRRGEAKGLSHRMKAYVHLTGVYDRFKVNIRPRSNGLTFWSRKVDRNAASKDMAVFAANILLRKNCEIISPPFNRSIDQYWIDTRKGELPEKAKDGAPAFNLNVVVRCGAKA